MCQTPHEKSTIGGKKGCFGLYNLKCLINISDYIIRSVSAHRQTRSVLAEISVWQFKSILNDINMHCSDVQT